MLYVNGMFLNQGEHLLQAHKSLKPNKASLGIPSLHPIAKPTDRPEARGMEDAWAAEGIERLAGKGWKEMQLETEQKENQAIKSRVRSGLLQKQVLLWRPDLPPLESLLKKMVIIVCEGSSYGHSSLSNQTSLSRILPSFSQGLLRGILLAKELSAGSQTVKQEGQLEEFQQDQNP